MLHVFMSRHVTVEGVLMIDISDFSKKQILFLFANNGDKLSFSNDNIVIKDKDGKVKHQSTCYRLFMVCVIGNISITSGLIQRAKKFGFSICLMTTSTKVYEIIGSRMEGNTVLRKYQYNYDDWNIGRYIIANKIKNQRETINTIRNKNQLQKDAIKKLDEHIKKLNNSELDMQEIMGIEGSAARTYFPQIFDTAEWSGRKPRIKCDYINSTLDIGYTILFNIIEAILNVYGFDTYYGVFHRCFYMRKSLVCDIMEPFRPIIDYQVRKSINLGQCRKDDFEVINQRYVLKYKKNPEYIAFLMDPIMNYRDSIFRYIQGYYRSFMKQKNIDEFPIFEI